MPMVRRAFGRGKVTLEVAEERGQLAHYDGRRGVAVIVSSDHVTSRAVQQGPCRPDRRWSQVSSMRCATCVKPE
jgi:hypothetical protein